MLVPDDIGGKDGVGDFLMEANLSSSDQMSVGLQDRHNSNRMHTFSIYGVLLGSYAWAWNGRVSFTALKSTASSKEVEIDEL